MTGIERLRTLAAARDEWILGGTLADIADQIERERECERDTIENLRLELGEARDEAAWVRDHGGLETVEARLMPDGMEWLLEVWPRLEDGKPVRFLDDFERYGNESCVSVVTMYADGSFALNFRAYSRGERVKRVKRPAVLASDGEPLEVGQTVWDTDAETDTPLTVVEVSSDLVRCEYTWKDGKTYRPCYRPSALTHTKPEPPDSWERIEEDAGCTATKYNERRGTIFTTKQQVARDLVRRARVLAELERSE